MRRTKKFSQATTQPATQLTIESTTDSTTESTSQSIDKTILRVLKTNWWQRNVWGLPGARRQVLYKKHKCFNPPELISARWGVGASSTPSSIDKEKMRIKLLPFSVLNKLFRFSMLIIASANVSSKEKLRVKLFPFSMLRTGSTNVSSK